MTSDNFLVELSRNLLLNVKLNKPVSTQIQQLKSIPIKKLQENLKNDDAKKAFWINVYNAFFQILSTSNRDPNKRIFKEKSILIAQTAFSLDDIEHGILRKYRWKKSFGYLPNPFSGSVIKNLAVEELDYRIHFALNCGAKSCPPIAYYSHEHIDHQLKMATESFLFSETCINHSNKLVSTSMLLLWYCGDFGGYFKIKSVLENYLERDLEGFKLKFNAYSWETQLNNYV